MKLRELKKKLLLKTINIKSELISKYADQRDKITSLVDMLIVKIHNLREHTLSDFIFTIYNISKEFPEFEELIKIVMSYEKNTS